MSCLPLPPPPNLIDVHNDPNLPRHEGVLGWPYMNTWALRYIQITPPSTLLGKTLVSLSLAWDAFVSDSHLIPVLSLQVLRGSMDKP